MKRKKFKPGQLVRYTQQWFNFPGMGPDLYDRVGRFLAYGDTNESWCLVNFPGLNFTSRVEAEAIREEPQHVSTSHNITT